MQPARLSKNALVAVLRDMANLVEADDSFEGSIEYTCMPEHEPTPPLEREEFMVKAFYRIGNSMGQGGVRLIESRL